MIDFKKFVPTEYAPKVTINVNLWTVFYKSHFLLLFIERFRTTSKLDWLHFNNYRSETIRLIKVTGQVIHEANSDMIVDITNLLRKTCNVSSINICFNFYTGKSSLIAMNICSMTHIHVKHLEVSIKDLVEAATVLYRLQLLSSVKFIFDYSPVWKPFIAWLEKQKKCSIYHMNIYFHRKTKSNSITSKKWYRIVKRKRPTWHSNNAYKKKEQKIHKNRVQLLEAV